MITVSIVTYKTNLEELSRCFQSLTSSLISRIYIVDNSNEPYIAEFCQQYVKVVYIASKNVGYGAGHNQALKQVLDTEEKYHLVLNPDVYFQPSVLDKIAEYMEYNEDVGQLIPNTVYPNGDLQFVCRLLPTPMNLIFRRFLPKMLAEKMDRRFLLKNYNRREMMDIPFLLGSFMFFRLSCFRRIGLFDESIFMYMEDIDITRRMHKYYKTMFWPEVTIVHAHKAASYKDKKMLRIHVESAIRYFNKWGWIWDKERSRWNAQVMAAVERASELDIFNDEVNG